MFCWEPLFASKPNDSLKIPSSFHGGLQVTRVHEDHPETTEGPGPDYLQWTLKVSAQLLSAHPPVRASLW